MMRLLFVLFFSFIFTSILFAQNTLIINQSGIYDKFNFHYLEDTSSKITIEEISKIDFKKTSKNNFNLGYHKGSLWFKFDLSNQSEYENFILSLNETFYEVANLYYFDQTWIKDSNSLFTLIKDREIKSNHLAFEINLPKNLNRTFYLELKGKYAYFGKVAIYEKSYFDYRNNFNVNILYTFVLGIVLALILFTLFLYTKTKERIYLYYFFYCFFNFIYFANISGLLVYVDLQKYIYELQLAPAFMIAFLILFSREYLETTRYLPKFDKVLKYMSVPFFIFGIMVVYSYQPWNKFINNSSGLVGITLIIVSFIVYFKGNHKTKFYTFAIVLYFTFIFMFAFMVAGVLEYSNLTRYGVTVVNAIEMIIFSYILASRYDIMNKQTQRYLETTVENRTTKLASLLNERELLLKELHHRVKNNFHMIIGMLHLENHKNSEEKDFLGLVNRVKSMSIIHEYLYKSKDLLNIDTKEYLEKIISNVNASCSRMTINSTIEDLSIDFDDALSLGIIINEILTNSIKHNSQINNFNVDIHLFEKNNNIYLLIQDNGEGFEKSSNKGLGLKLVDQFSRKLQKADYDFSFENGTRFQLHFEAKK